MKGKMQITQRNCHRLFRWKL